MPFLSMIPSLCSIRCIKSSEVSNLDLISVFMMSKVFLKDEKCILNEAKVYFFVYLLFLLHKVRQEELN